MSKAARRAARAMGMKSVSTFDVLSDVVLTDSDIHEFVGSRADRRALYDIPVIRVYNARATGDITAWYIWLYTYSLSDAPMCRVS